MKTQQEMSEEYCKYLKNHVSNVKNAFEWMKLTFDFESGFINILGALVSRHDSSKFHPEEEFFDYMMYFYSDEKSKEIEDNFNRAWLHHIHNNPHHWQYWVLIEDSGNLKPLDIPIEFIYEMICDWWSFSWSKNNLYEIFDWYSENKNKMILSDNTRKIVEQILDNIKSKLDEK